MALVGLLTSAVTAIGLAALGTRSATWARTAVNRHDTGDAPLPRCLPPPPVEAGCICSAAAKASQPAELS